MREYPAQKLDPKIKSVWRLSDLIWIVTLYAVVMVVFVLLGNLEDVDWTGFAMTFSTVVFAVLLVIFMIVIPPIRYSRWRYDISPDYLEIARGIIWRKRFVIPFIRVQNTDTKQGPLLRAFHLSSVTVSTAAGAHEISGLREGVAAELRDKAAEFARLAREDV